MLYHIETLIGDFQTKSWERVVCESSYGIGSETWIIFQDALTGEWNFINDCKINMIKEVDGE